MVLEFYEFEYHKNFSNKFEVHFFQELELLELEFHDKLEFYKLEFKKGGRSLHISKTVIDC